MEREVRRPLIQKKAAAGLAEDIITPIPVSFPSKRNGLSESIPPSMQRVKTQEAEPEIIVIHRQFQLYLNIKKYCKCFEGTVSQADMVPSFFLN